jgi:hypothetical protein
MLHKEWEDLIPFYVNQTLPDHQALELAQHLAHCGTCQKALDDWRNIVGALYSAADEWSRDLPPLSIEVRAKISGAVPANVVRMPPPPKQRFTQPLPPRRKRASFPLLPFVAAAAVAVIVFGAIFAVGMRGFLDSRVEQDPTQQVAVNWQTNTPRPEETLSPSHTPTTSLPIPHRTSVQQIVPTNMPPSATNTPTVTPFVPTDTPPVIPSVEGIVEDGLAGSVRIYGGDDGSSPAQVVSFDAYPNTVQPGGMVVLNWEVVEANHVRIVADFDDDGVYDFDQDNLPLNGTTQAVISASQGASETFYLQAYDNDSQAYSEAAFTVVIQCPYTYFFFGYDCPDGNEVEVSVNVQRFENGYVLLRNLSGEGIVLFDNGTIGELGMADVVGEMPPEGLMPPAPDLIPYYRSNLGWATGAMETHSGTIRGEPFNPAADRQSMSIRLSNGEEFQINRTNGNFTSWN